MNTPIVETMVSRLCELLEEIIGDPDYYVGDTIRSVQRYKSEWDGAEKVSNLVGALPTIVIKELDESLDWSRECGTVIRTMSFDIACYPQTDSSSEARNWIAADLERAITKTDDSGQWDGLGVNAVLVTGGIVKVDPETGIYLDGVHFVFDVVYRTKFGDPASGV